MSRFFVYCEGVVYFTETIDDTAFSMIAIQDAFSTIYNAKTLEIATPFTVTFTSVNFQNSEYIEISFDKQVCFVYSIGLTVSSTIDYFNQTVVGSGVEYSNNYMNINLMFLDYILNNYDKTKYILNSNYNVPELNQMFCVYNPIFTCARIKYSEFTWFHDGSSINNVIVEKTYGTNHSKGYYATKGAKGFYCKTTSSSNTISFDFNSISYTAVLFNSVLRNDQFADIITAAMNIAIKDIIYSENTSILAINSGNTYYIGNTNSISFDITSVNAGNVIFLNSLISTKQKLTGCISFYFGSSSWNIFLGDSNHNIVYTNAIIPGSIDSGFLYANAIPSSFFGIYRKLKDPSTIDFTKLSDYFTVDFPYYTFNTTTTNDISDSNTNYTYVFSSPVTSLFSFYYNNKSDPDNFPMTLYFTGIEIDRNYKHNISVYRFIDRYTSDNCSVNLTFLDNTSGFLVISENYVSLLTVNYDNHTVNNKYYCYNGSNFSVNNTTMQNNNIYFDKYYYFAFIRGFIDKISGDFVNSIEVKGIEVKYSCEYVVQRKNNSIRFNQLIQLNKKNFIGYISKIDIVYDHYYMNINNNPTAIPDTLEFLTDDPFRSEIFSDTPEFNSVNYTENKQVIFNWNTPVSLNYHGNDHKGIEYSENYYNTTFNVASNSSLFMLDNCYYVNGTKVYDKNNNSVPANGNLIYYANYKALSFRSNNNPDFYYIVNNLSVDNYLLSNGVFKFTQLLDNISNATGINYTLENNIATFENNLTAPFYLFQVDTNKIKVFDFDHLNYNNTFRFYFYSYSLNKIFRTKEIPNEFISDFSDYLDTFYESNSASLVTIGNVSIITDSTGVTFEFNSPVVPVYSSDNSGAEYSRNYYNAGFYVPGKVPVNYSNTSVKFYNVPVVTINDTVTSNVSSVLIPRTFDNKQVYINKNTPSFFIKIESNNCVIHCYFSNKTTKQITLPYGYFTKVNIIDFLQFKSGVTIFNSGTIVGYYATQAANFSGKYIGGTFFLGNFSSNYYKHYTTRTISYIANDSSFYFHIANDKSNGVFKVTSNTFSYSDDPDENELMNLADNLTGNCYKPLEINGDYVPATFVNITGGITKIIGNTFEFNNNVRAIYSFCSTLALTRTYFRIRTYAKGLEFTDRTYNQTNYSLYDNKSTPLNKSVTFYKLSDNVISVNGVIQSLELFNDYNGVYNNEIYSLTDSTNSTVLFNEVKDNIPMYLPRGFYNKYILSAAIPVCHLTSIETKNNLEMPGHQYICTVLGPVLNISCYRDDGDPYANMAFNYQQIQGNQNLLTMSMYSNTKSLNFSWKIGVKSQTNFNFYHNTNNQQLLLYSENPGLPQMTALYTSLTETPFVEFNGSELIFSEPIIIPYNYNGIETCPDYYKIVVNNTVGQTNFPFSFDPEINYYSYHNLQKLSPINYSDSNLNYSIGSNLFTLITSDYDNVNFINSSGSTKTFAMRLGYLSTAEFFDYYTTIISKNSDYQITSEINGNKVKLINNVSMAFNRSNFNTTLLNNTVLLTNYPTITASSIEFLVAPINFPGTVYRSLGLTTINNETTRIYFNVPDYPTDSPDILFAIAQAFGNSTNLTNTETSFNYCETVEQIEKGFRITMKYPYEMYMSTIGSYDVYSGGFDGSLNTYCPVMRYYFNNDISMYFTGIEFSSYYRNVFMKQCTEYNDPTLPIKPVTKNTFEIILKDYECLFDRKENSLVPLFDSNGNLLVNDIYTTDNYNFIYNGVDYYRISSANNTITTGVQKNNDSVDYNIIIKTDTAEYTCYNIALAPDSYYISPTWVFSNNNFMVFKVIYNDHWTNKIEYRTCRKTGGTDITYKISFPKELRIFMDTPSENSYYYSNEFEIIQPWFIIDNTCNSLIIDNSIIQLNNGTYTELSIFQEIKRILNNNGIDIRLDNNQFYYKLNGHNVNTLCPNSINNCLYFKNLILQSKKDTFFITFVK